MRMETTATPRNNLFSVGSEILITMPMKGNIFWNVTRCSLVEIDRLSEKLIASNFMANIGLPRNQPQLQLFNSLSAVQLNTFPVLEQMY
jgi:hypothetical protein